MKIGCHCGATIIDSMDCISHKAHLTPDQSVFEVMDGIDSEVIDPVSSNDLAPEKAYMVSRRIIACPTRLMWQCTECGRLYINGLDGELHCFVPESDRTDRRILRGRVGK